jgi:hypothetical protein
VWRDVVAPVLLTRAGLLLIGWLSRFLPANPDYPRAFQAARGWAVTPWRLLDMWARWDSGWYLGIVRDGYSLRGRILGAQSNFAFFPLYPYAVKAISMVLPAAARTDLAYLVIGVVLSNLCLLGGLVLVRQLVAESEGESALARRTVWLMLLFPTSFFFGCFFTEALFLLISVAALTAARRHCWWAAGLLGGLLAVTRPNGVLIAVPLAFAYLAARDWQPRRIGPDAGWLLLVPAGLLAYMLALLPITGDLLAPVKIQAAWGKIAATPWDTLFDPRYPFPYTTAIERWVILALLVVAARSFWLLKERTHAVYAAVFLAAPLFTGVLDSQARYAAPLFPLFAALARMSESDRADRLLKALSGALLAVAFAAWCRFYWVG